MIIQALSLGQPHYKHSIGVLYSDHIFSAMEVKRNYEVYTFGISEVISEQN